MTNDLHIGQCADHYAYLFVPANRPERFAKALASGADAIIIDLEDAVAAEEKAAARRYAATAIKEGLFSGKGPSVYVRINAADTEWFVEDLALIKEAATAGVMLPKAEHAEQIARIHAGAKKLCRVIPVIETAAGLVNAQAIAQADGVERLAFGSIDFQLDLNCAGSDAALLYARSQLVVISRCAGLAAPIDGVTVALEDAAQLSHDAQHAKSLGMGAKLCIHPRQLGVVKAAWQPTAEEIAWAKKVVAALAKAGDGERRGQPIVHQNAIQLDGMMIDRPVLARAQRILAWANA
ncbi:MAG: CoA ester lyase [Rugosibacter sp.]|jgi:citrate lyase subunit beta/citryl-CoA lyase|nr:citrate lyase subunit beta / citryl-CoA lyase [Rugosibacter sp.]